METDELSTNQSFEEGVRSSLLLSACVDFVITKMMLVIPCMNMLVSVIQFHSIRFKWSSTNQIDWWPDSHLLWKGKRGRSYKSQKAHCVLAFLPWWGQGWGACSRACLKVIGKTTVSTSFNHPKESKSWTVRAQWQGLAENHWVGLGFSFCVHKAVHHSPSTFHFIPLPYRFSSGRTRHGALEHHQLLKCI